MKYFVRALKLYTTTTGRDNRREYWSFIAAYVVIAILIEVLEVLLLTFYGGKIWYLLISYVYHLALLWPMATAGIRRLHDSGRTGLWLLLLAVPILGWIWLIDLLLWHSDPCDNKYGPAR